MMYASEPHASGNLNPAVWRKLRTEALNFALQRVNNSDVANDIVQDSIEQALLNVSTFAGRSTFKTWLFGIIKHKALDFHRLPKSVPIEHDGWLPFDAMNLSDWHSDGDLLMNITKMETGRPELFCVCTPETNLETKEFWQAVNQCLHTLPEAARQIFMMRELLGYDYLTISSHTQLSVNHCHVVLHRTRKKLKHHLQLHGFCSVARKHD
jgi:RNA polymerase sigma-70 factor, ECF subfamily